MFRKSFSFIFVWEGSVNRNCFSFIEKSFWYYKLLVSIIEIIHSFYNELTKENSFQKLYFNSSCL